MSPEVALLKPGMMSACRSLSGAKRTLSKPHSQTCEYAPWLNELEKVNVGRAQRNPHERVLGTNRVSLRADRGRSARRCVAAAAALGHPTAGCRARAARGQARSL